MFLTLLLHIFQDLHQTFLEDTLNRTRTATAATQPQEILSQTVDCNQPQTAQQQQQQQQPPHKQDTTAEKFSKDNAICTLKDDNANANDKDYANVQFGSNLA